ncbi:hypothetical protein Tco_0527406 [Tanacetum coccineum]
MATSGFHGVNEPGGVRVIREDDLGVTEGREDVREVFQQRRSGAKRKLSRCGRNQLGNEPILVLPEGANNFVVYYDAQGKDLEACLEKGRSDQLEWVLWYASWLSDQLEWICGMLHGLVINWSSSAIETSRNHVNVFFIYHSNDLIGFKGELNGAKIERSV